MAAVLSTDAFFAEVRRLFELLDLDSDGVVDHSEATLGLSHCFEAVHHIDSPASSSRQQRSVDASAPPAVSASHKQRAVANQVSWLFSAAHHSPAADSAARPGPLQLSEFTECYHRLLQSGYEPEVLHVDLTRAIDALHSSQQWQSMERLLRAARRLFGLRLASSDAGVRRSVVQSTFSAATDGQASWSFASSKAEEAVQAVAQRLVSGAAQLTEAEWLQAWKEAVQADFDYAAATRHVDAIAGVSTEAVNGH